MYYLKKEILKESIDFSSDDSDLQISGDLNLINLNTNEYETLKRIVEDAHKQHGKIITFDGKLK